MKATDYIVEFLVEKGVKHVFGYPGGVVCHLMDSLFKYKNDISAHATYHEQAAAFAACAYGQASGNPGVAYATSGPGATNLVTGIANAYYDSIPTVFFTGQVDTYGLKGAFNIRQKGFQETDVVAITKSITKYAKRIDKVEDLPYCLEAAWWHATNGRRGPVLIDLPADVQRAQVDVNNSCHFVPEISEYRTRECVDIILGCLSNAKRPCVLVGAGIKQTLQVANLRKFLERWNVPAVFSLPAFDILSHSHSLNMGFIGANGHRQASFAIDKCDVLLTLGSRLDLKQVGNNRKNFAPQSHIIRVDIDSGELEYKLHENEQSIKCDLSILMPALLEENNFVPGDYSKWIDTCKVLREKLSKVDFAKQHNLLDKISDCVSAETNVTIDVGQHQLWVAQAFKMKVGQQAYLSGGHGAMGYSLPAAIGVYYATGKPVISFNGDGGVQMNMQELQFIRREKLPITVIVLNNKSLGMIRQFQKMNFEENYIHTTELSGYTSPDFASMASAYGIKYNKIDKLEEVEMLNLNVNEPNFLEIILPTETMLLPNFSRNGIFHDKEPLIDRALFAFLDKL